MMSDAASDSNMSNSRPPEQEAELSAEEEAATKKFLENVNKWRAARKLEEVRKTEMY